jgi:prolipoprotein diacylglyceryltransferase
MEKIAFISNNTFIYWSPLILALAITAGIGLYGAVYLRKGGNLYALSISILMSAAFGLFFGRLIHWYSRSAAYEGFFRAITDYSRGGFALAGGFMGCILSAFVIHRLGLIKSSAKMLDSMALGGGLAIAAGRLACLFNSADRGMVLSPKVIFPFAYPVINAVSGESENRLATFMFQSILTFGIVAALIAYMVYEKQRAKKIRDGDICLLFLLAHGAAQIVCDSTRYDSLFFRSNGFVSIVQILGLVAMLIPIVLFSLRLVMRHGLKLWMPGVWVGMIGLVGLAGYMEYYVQRNAHMAALSYCLMSASLIAVVFLAVLIWHLGKPTPKPAPAEHTESPAVS